MKQPETIGIESKTKTVDTIRQVHYRVKNNEKRTQLNRLLLAERPESCIIFCNTRIAVDRVQQFLSRKGYATGSLHGDIPQAKRTRTIQQFKQGRFPLLVATDVAARGIHVDDLSLVINYDVPNEKDSYVHRIGRTGRAGQGGRAISLVTDDDIITLYEIEEHIKVLIPEADLPTDALLKTHQPKIEAWITAMNTANIKAPQPATKPAVGGPAKKTSQPKTTRAPQSKSSQSKSLQNQQRSNKRTDQIASHSERQTKAEQEDRKIRALSTGSTESVISKRGPEARQIQTPTSRKSFLQRIVHRVLGK